MAEAKTKPTTASVDDFAVRGRDLVVYLLADSAERAALLPRPARLVASSVGDGKRRHPIRS